MSDKNYQFRCYEVSLGPSLTTVYVMATDYGDAEKTVRLDPDLRHAIIHDIKALGRPGFAYVSPLIAAGVNPND